MVLAWRCRMLIGVVVRRQCQGEGEEAVDDDGSSAGV